MFLTSLENIPFEGVSHNPEIRKKIILKSGQIPALTNFSIAVFSPGQETKFHQHADMFEVFFVTKGTAKIIVNSDELVLEAGSCIVIEPKEMHAIRNIGNSELNLTYFGILANNPE